MTTLRAYQSSALEQFSLAAFRPGRDVEWEILGTADDVVDELLMLAMLHNFAEADYAAMVKLQRSYDLESLGLRFDNYGKLHINSARVKVMFSQDSESVHRVTRSLRLMVEMDCCHDAL